MRTFMKGLLVGAVLFFGASALPTAAAAGPNAGYRLVARVPVACWVRPEGGPINSDTGSGRVVEACNSPGGFAVHASYRTLDGDEDALFHYGDRQIQLPHSGNVLLRRSGIAQIRSVDYRFEKTTLKAPVVMVLTIQPI